MVLLHQNVDALEFYVLLDGLLVRALTVHLCQLQALRLASSLLEVDELFDPFFSLEFNPGSFYHLVFYWETTILDVLKQLKIFLQIETIFGLFKFLLLKVLDDIVDFLNDLLNINALVRFR